MNRIKITKLSANPSALERKDASWSPVIVTVQPPVNGKVVFQQAIGDFDQVNMLGVQRKQVKGRLLKNGNFIFYWASKQYIKLVLTTNTGKFIKCGWLKKPAKTWLKPDTWINRKRKYRIINFKGLKPVIIRPHVPIRPVTPVNTIKVFIHANVKYQYANRKRCGTVTKPECMAIAKARGIRTRPIINPRYHNFPRGCYHRQDNNTIYFNEKPSRYQCTARRVCICKPFKYGKGLLKPKEIAHDEEQFEDELDELEDEENLIDSVQGDEEEDEESL
jgi:hypothetical protein